MARPLHLCGRRICHEEQEAYVDSLGNTIGVQKIHATGDLGGLCTSFRNRRRRGQLTGGLAGVWSAPVGQLSRKQ